MLTYWHCDFGLDCVSGIWIVDWTKFLSHCGLFWRLIISRILVQGSGTTVRFVLVPPFHSATACWRICMFLQTQADITILTHSPAALCPPLTHLQDSTISTLTSTFCYCCNKIFKGYLWCCASFVSTNLAESSAL